MTQEQAEKLLDHAITTTGTGGAYLYRIANGELVVRIKAKDFWLWSFADLTAYAHDLKHQKKKQRQADRAQHGIDPQESYRLVLFA
jgi:hypothetical protein